MHGLARVAGVPAAPVAAHRQPAPAGQQGKRAAPRASEHRLRHRSPRPDRHLERLRIDCQLAEAITTGFDPLHLAQVFGISEHTAIRYAVNARQLTGPAPQAGTPGSPAAPGSMRENRAAPLTSS